MKFFFGVFLLLCFSSCKRSTKTFYKTGELQERFYTNDEGQKHGTYKRYHLNGKLAEEVNYENGLRQGKRVLFFEDGKVESESNYQNDLVNGISKVYYPSGEIKVEYPYINNVINGTFKKYFKNGTVMEEVTFANNQENGPFKEYYENGNLKWEGTFIDGDKEIGLLQEYAEDGTLVKKMMCDTLIKCQTIWHKDSTNPIKPKFNEKEIAALKASIKN
jgi:antitoxin component YwqK of YwqJK toxin-antitoxin module